MFSLFEQINTFLSKGMNSFETKETEIDKGRSAIHG